MADDRGRREPSVGPGPAEGPRPSPRARERFAAELRSEVEVTRAAWYDAALRGRERLQAGDDHGAMEAIEDQHRLLRLLERRLERAVASAVVEREAEGVLAGSAASVRAGSPPESAAVTPPRPTGREESDAEEVHAHAGGRLRALVAAGAAAAVAALAVGLGALVGPVTTPAPEVAGPVDGTMDAAAPEDAGSEGQQEVGTAEQSPPLPVEPLTSTLLPRGWMNLWSAQHHADDEHPAARAQREEAAPEGPDQRGDTAEAAAPSPPAEDREAQGDASRDEPDADPGADDTGPEERDELLDLRRLLQPEDDPADEDGDSRDEELPEADADGTVAPDEDPEERGDGAEEPVDVTTRLNRGL